MLATVTRHALGQNGKVARALLARRYAAQPAGKSQHELTWFMITLGGVKNLCLHKKMCHHWDRLCMPMLDRCTGQEHDEHIMTCKPFM